MALAWGRDKRGRLYWYDPATGRRLKAPAATERPRTFHRDKNGRGYWLWGDTGRRAPKPEWDQAPRYDRAGRPLDSTGRRIPRTALAGPEPVLGPAPDRTKPRAPKKAPKPVRPRLPARVRAQVRRGSEPVPGFHRGGSSVYVSRPCMSAPKDLHRIFENWLRGAVAKSPFASASEIGFRQFGVAFKVRAPLDSVSLADLTDRLQGQPVRVVYRVTGPNEWEVWMHLNRPERRTGEVRQRGYRYVSASFRAGEAAANIIYDFLDDWGGDLFWYEYFETEDFVYEG